MPTPVRLLHIVSVFLRSRVLDRRNRIGVLLMLSLATLFLFSGKHFVEKEPLDYNFENKYVAICN